MQEPVEYAVAVDRYLAAAALGDGSRRVYRIALATWAWALVEGAAPSGGERRGAAAPGVPLHLLDAPRTPELLRAAFAARSTEVGPRTANRELSVFKGAVAWWRARGWLQGDPAAGLHPLPVQGRRAPGAPSPSPEQIRAVLARPAPLRERALWHLLHESGSAIERVLALDVDDLDLPARRTRHGREPRLHWGEGAAALLPLLVLGRVTGPVFATSRGRLSYRRAAELFTAAAPDGWTLRTLAPTGAR